MNYQIEVTVYLVNRNYQNYISQSINSVLNQSFTNFELIIIDDASTDNSRSIISKYINNKKVRVIFNKKRKGLIKNCNLAIRASKGKYILRLDADDYLNKNALKYLHSKILDDKRIGMVFPDYFYINTNGNTLGRQNQSFNFKNKFESQKVPHGACSLINKNFLFEVGLYDEKIDRQDGYDIWFKLSSSYKIVHLKKPLFYYRQHNKNLTTNKKLLFKSRNKIYKNNLQNLYKNKKTKNSVIIPVRGTSISQTCYSLRKFKGKSLLNTLINKLVKLNFINHIIVVSSDEKIKKTLKYKNKKVKFYKRNIEQSLENIDYKIGILNAIKSYKLKPDNIFILNFLYPNIDPFYFSMALNTLKIHNFDKVISVYPDNETHYYKEEPQGLKIISNSRNKFLKLERDNIYIESGGISVEKFKSFIGVKSKKKIGKVVIDFKSAQKFIN